MKNIAYNTVGKDNTESRISRPPVHTRSSAMNKPWGKKRREGRVAIADNCMSNSRTWDFTSRVHYNASKHRACVANTVVGIMSLTPSDVHKG